jgi:hypothetical protein
MVLSWIVGCNGKETYGIYYVNTAAFFFEMNAQHERVLFIDLVWRCLSLLFPTVQSKGTIVLGAG